MKHVLFISSGADGAPHLDVLARFSAQLTQQSTDASVTSCAVQQLVFAVHDQTIHIYLNGVELHEQYDVLHLRNINFFTDYGNALRLYADHYDMRLINRADAVLPYYGKVSQGFFLTLHQLPTPDLVSSPGNQTLLGAIRGMQFPLIVKHNEGIKGRDNYLVKSYDEAEDILSKERPGFVAQPFIANSGELRVLTFGADQEPLVFKKTAGEGSHLNNTSQGGAGTLLQGDAVPIDIVAVACRAAELMGREIGGVDVLLARDGTFSILEVNFTPSLASGVFIPEKQKRYITFLAETEQTA
jgi:glutathione synthase/RimK-type ligase-like ATP-grasp enzyme